MADKPEKLNERYTLWEKIASGGMADVYRATEYGAKGSSKTVALKKILSNFSSNPEYRRMFIDEGIIGSQLTHANICQVNPLIEIEENLYIPMEFIEGKNLRQVINKYKKKLGIKPLPVPLAVFVVNEVLKGLDYAHTKLDENSGKALNIVHRDMSPQNIMLSYEGGVKLIDFGIAKAKILTNETRAGVIKGKYSYMSPEQAVGGQLGPQSDVFSTGIVLWELLTGERLFQSENDMATLKAIQDCDLKDREPIKKNAEVTSELNRIVMKLLTKDLSLRFKNAEHAQQVLQKYLNEKHGAYSSRDLKKFLGGLFVEEIVAEKKKAADLYSTTVTNSQRKFSSSNKDLQQVAQVLDKEITRTEVSESGGVTNTDFSLQDDSLTGGGQGKEEMASSAEATRLESSEKTAVSIDQENFRVPSLFGEDNRLESRSERSVTEAGVPVENDVPIEQKPNSAQSFSEASQIELLDAPEVGTQVSASQEIWSVTGTGTSAPESDSRQSSLKMELDHKVEKSQSSIGFEADNYQQNSHRGFESKGLFGLVLGALGLTVISVSIYYFAFSANSKVFNLLSQRGPTATHPVTKPDAATENAELNSFQCKVSIETDPPGATLIGENFKGNSATGVIAIPCEETAVIRIEKEGYETYKLSVVPNKKSMQKIPRVNLLAAKLGSVVLAVDNNSAVFIDGKDYGNITANTLVEFKLSPGLHQFTFKNEVLGLTAQKNFQVVDKERTVESKTIRLNDTSGNP